MQRHPCDTTTLQEVMMPTNPLENAFLGPKIAVFGSKFEFYDFGTFSALLLGHLGCDSSISLFRPQ
jgi:hypothetical protein